MKSAWPSGARKCRRVLAPYWRVASQRSAGHETCSATSLLVAATSIVPPSSTTPFSRHLVLPSEQSLRMADRLQRAGSHRARYCRASTSIRQEARQCGNLRRSTRPMLQALQPAVRTRVFPVRGRTMETATTVHICATPTATSACRLSRRRSAREAPRSQRASDKPASRELCFPWDRNPSGRE